MKAARHRYDTARRAIFHPVRSFLTALGFLSVLPIGVAGRHDGDYFAPALFHFTLVGLFLGSLTAVLCLALQLVFPPLPVAALLAVMLSLLTGFIHLDGLADTADGFFSGRPREVCLEIMRDSRIGVMGSAAVCSLLVIKTAVLASIVADQLPFALMVAAAAGRTGIVCMMAALPYARSEGGLGRLFYSDATRQAAVCSSLLLAILIVLLATGRILLLISVFALVILLSVSICRKKINGATGDTLGAVCELTETALLVAFAVSL